MLKLTGFKKVKNIRKKRLAYKSFLQNYVIPYLTSMGYVKNSSKFYNYFYYFQKGDDSILFNRKLYGNYGFFIISNKNEVLGTIVYDRIYPEFYFYLFQMDLFGIYNKELAEEIKEFPFIKDYYLERGKELKGYRETRTKPIGTNPVSRRIHYRAFYKNDNYADKEI